jgi:hypothetical protein
MEKKKSKNTGTAPGNKPCGELVSDLDDDDDMDEINLLTPTPSSPSLKNFQPPPSSSFLSIGPLTQDQTSPDQQPLCDVVCDDDSVAISLDSLGSYPKNSQESYKAIFMSQLPQQSSCHLFPPPLRQQEKATKVPRQVSNTSMTDGESWNAQPLSSHGQKPEEGYPFSVESNEEMICQGRDTSLENMISDMVELDSFLQSCF